MADEFKLDFDKIVVEQNGGWAGGTLDWMGAFARSAVESIPELVGITPSDETVRWRSANPWSGLGSELAGMAVPYAGWLRAARGIKALESVAKGVEATKLGTAAGEAAWGARLAEAPFLTGARAEAVRLAPFEIGRVAISQGIGDQSLSDMAFGAGMNMALGAGVAGGFAKLGTMGKVAPPIREAVPGLNDAVPGQLLLRELDKRLPELPELQTRLPEIELRVRGEEAPKGTRYVDPVLDSKGQLEKLFRAGTDDGGYIEKRKLVTGSRPGEFSRDEDWIEAVRAAGVEPQEATRLMQFPRVVSFNAAREMDLEANIGVAVKEFPQTQKRAQWAERAIMDRLAPVGDGWVAARESNDGMFVMAKKVAGDMPGEVPAKNYLHARIKLGREKVSRRFESEDGLARWLQKNPKAKIETAEWRMGKPGLKSNASIDDKWLLFKTDQPGRFAKNSQAFMNTHTARERWIVGSNALETYEKAPGLVGDTLRLQATFPHDKFMDVANVIGNPQGFQKWWQKAAPKALRNNAASQHGADFIRTWVAPADKQLGKSPRGAWIMNQARMIQESVDSWVQKTLQGELTFKGPRAVFSKIVNTPSAGRSVVDILTDMDKEGLFDEFLRLHRQGIPVAGARQMAAEGKLNPRTAELASELRTIRETEHRFLNQSEEVAGAKLSKLREDDYGLPRVWTGDFMQVVREEGGRIVGLGAGGSAKAAAANAEALSRSLTSETGRSHRLGESFHRGQDFQGLPADVRPLLENPGGMLGNCNIRGFKWDLETPKLKDLVDEYNQALGGRGKSIANNLREGSLARHLGALAAEDPAASKIVAMRFNQLAGKESQFSKLQNKLVDRVLGPIFGANTATKIVSGLNTGLVHVQLGAFKLSYPIQNIIGTIQTVMPELAFVLNAPDDLLTRTYMQSAPLMGKAGAQGSVSTLAPMKVMGQALRMAWKPTKDERAALEWALNNRVLDARVAEEFIGQNRRTLSSWKGALTSPKAFGEFGLALSEWMPIHSERFARVIAFNAAYKLFKDVARITDEDVLRLQAKRFVERTNYMYSAADRPIAFTTPIGSALGLFKTWQMNFIYTMAEYANLGFNKGVWSPLMWQTLGTAAVGGAAATPLYWAADGASLFLADKKLVQFAYDEWGDGADGVMFGLPAALTGVSLSSLMTTPGANPVKDATQLFSFASFTRMKELGGAIGAAVDNWRATGQHPASDPDVRNGLIKAFAPVILNRYMSLDEDRVRNISTGMVSAKGLSFYDKFMYAAGMNPVGVERQMVASDALFHNREQMRAATRALGDALREAWDSGDAAGADRVLQRAIGLGADISSVMRSANTRGRQAEKTSAERLGSPAELSKWSNVRGF